MNSILEDFKQAFRTGNILNQLIVINVVVFVLIMGMGVIMRLSGAELLYLKVYDYLSLPSNLNDLVTQPLSLITYMFMHRDFMHILFNMLVLYWFGKFITGFLGQNKLLGLYFWGGLGGAATYILLYNLLPYYAPLVEGSMLVGASASVLAVVVGAATFQPNFSVQLLIFGPVRIKYIAAIYVALSFFRMTGPNGGGEIAHLGGALIGYIMISQLQKGNDWSKPVVLFILWVKSFFSRQPKMNVSYKNKETTTRKTRKTAAKPSGPSGKKESTSQVDIDAILDKISDKGYDALSKEEKQKLFNASKD